MLVRARMLGLLKSKAGKIKKMYISVWLDGWCRHKEKRNRFLYTIQNIIYIYYNYWYWGWDTTPCGKEICSLPSPWLTSNLVVVVKFSKKSIFCFCKFFKKFNNFFQKGNLKFCVMIPGFRDMGRSSMLNHFLWKTKLG